MRQDKGTTVLACVLALSVITWAASAGAEDAAPAAPEAAAPEAAAPEATPQQSVDELIAGLASTDSTTRVASARALGEQREASAVPQMINLLRADPVPEVRGWVVRSLHDIGTPEARSAVVTAAREDPDERVRNMAARLEGVSAPPPQPFQAAPTYPQAQPGAPQVAQTYEPAPQIAPVQRPPRVPGRGLRTGGWVATGVSYGLSLIVGIALLAAGDESDPDPWSGTVETRNYTDWGWKLLLPIVGPAVAATTNDMGEASIPFWIWTAVEIAGVALLAVGYVRRARYLREQDEGEDDVAGQDVGEGDPEEETLEDDDTYEDEETYDDEAAMRRFGVAFVPAPGGLSLTGWF